MATPVTADFIQHRQTSQLTQVCGNFDCEWRLDMTAGTPQTHYFLLLARLNLPFISDEERGAPTHDPINAFCNLISEKSFIPRALDINLHSVSIVCTNLPRGSLRPSLCRVLENFVNRSGLPLLHGLGLRLEFSTSGMTPLSLFRF
jgi:hypothetical protein